MRRFFSKKARLRLLRRQSYSCAMCGIAITPQSCEVDHIIPFSKGGLTVPENSQALCIRCNNKKSNTMSTKTSTIGFQDWQAYLPDNAPAPREWQVEGMIALRNYLDEKDPQCDFTLKADPGFGKSWFAAYSFLGLRCERLIDWLVLVVPTTNLVQQYIDDFSEVGLNLTTAAFGKDRKMLVESGYCGEVVTYATIQHSDNQAVYQKQAMSYGGRWLMVLDEVHHLGEVAYITDEQAAEQKAWAKALDSALRPYVSYRISMSGTLFRSDEWSLIPGIRYRQSEDGNIRIAAPHYETQPAEGVANGWTRRMIFYTNDGRVTWLQGNAAEAGIKEMAVQLSDPLQSKQLRAKGMNYALQPSAEYGQTLFSLAYADLCERREKRSRAGMLIICRDAAHARSWMDYLEDAGHEPVLVLGEDPESNDVIKRFRKGSGEIIVAVKKVSEGCSIKRLEVVLMLTNVTTRMYFNQSAGRANRNITGEYETGSVYCPAIPEFMEYALEYEKNFLHVHEQKESGDADEVTGDRGDNESTDADDDSDRVPPFTVVANVETEHLGNGVTTASAVIAEAHMEKALEYCRTHGYPTSQAPMMAKFMQDHAAPDQEAGCSEAPRKPKKPLIEELEDERQRYNNGASILATKIRDQLYPDADNATKWMLSGKIRPMVNRAAIKAGHPGSNKKDKESTRDLVAMKKKADWVHSPTGEKQVMEFISSNGGV